MAMIVCPDPDCSKRVSDQALACPHCGHPITSALPGKRQRPAGRAHGVVDSPYAQEVTFYSDERGVRITNTRAIVKNRTYSMANITSVTLRTVPPNFALPGLLTIVGVAVIIATAAGARHSGDVFSGLLLALAMLGIGLLWLFMAQPTYTVRIASAGGESTALQSKDKGYVEIVVDALNEAIVRRG